MEEGGSKSVGVEGAAPVPDAMDGPDVQSMAAVKGRGASLCQVVAVLANVALLLVSHVGVNAVIWSTKSLAGAGTTTTPGINNGTAGNATTLPPTAGVCNADDLAVWLGEKSLGTSGSVCKTWDANIKASQRKCPYSEVKALQSVRNDVLFLVGYAGILGTLGGVGGASDAVLGADWGMSAPCASCFSAAVTCTTASCAGECGGRLSSFGCPLNSPAADAACQDCVKTNCVDKPGALLDCAGLPASSTTVINNCGAGGDKVVAEPDAVCLTVDAIVNQKNATFFDVFHITFFNAITKAWDGGAYVLSVVIFTASFLWPYTKDAIMMVVWFRPMTHARRDHALLWLARLGRWSLVDVFAVIVIIIGLRIDKKLPTGDQLSTRSSSAYSIYTFAVAALWALVQGEYIRHINRADMKKGCVVLAEHVMPKHQRARLQYALLACSSAALALFGAGLLMQVCSFQLGGLAATTLQGANRASYTGLQIGTALIDSCQFGYPGEAFLAAVFFFTTLLAPLLALLVFIAFAAQPRFFVDSHRGLLRCAINLGNFACLDVFFLSLLVLIAQFKPLVAGSIGKQVEQICGTLSPGLVCIEFVGSLELGAYLIAIAAPLMWLSLYLVGRTFNEYRIAREYMLKSTHGNIDQALPIVSAAIDGSWK
jgi:hypothetical protein